MAAEEVFLVGHVADCVDFVHCAAELLKKVHHTNIIVKIEGDMG